MPEHTGQFDPDKRKEEILRQLEQRGDKARDELAILPYYHQLENEIIQPNRGIYLTRYFLEKWMPDLGMEASKLVLCLRLSADAKTKITIIGRKKLAALTGMSERSLKRWLSRNPDALKDRSEEWRRQWRYLHDYFILEYSLRHFTKTVPGQGNVVRRASSQIKIALDDPVHPSDEGKLHVLAAERIVAEEEQRLKAQSLGVKGPAGPLRGSITISLDELEAEDAEPVDNSDVKGLSLGPLILGPKPGPQRSYSYRSNDNVSNVLAKPGKAKSLGSHPVVAAMSPEERASKEGYAIQIGDRLKAMSQSRDPGLHKSAGFHKRIAFLMPEALIEQALMITRDAVDSAREGKMTLRSTPGYFAGVIKKLADEHDIDLGLQSNASPGAS